MKYCSGEYSPTESNRLFCSCILNNWKYYSGEYSTTESNNFAEIMTTMILFVFCITESFFFFLCKVTEKCIKSTILQPHVLYLQSEAPLSQPEPDFSIFGHQLIMEQVMSEHPGHCGLLCPKRYHEVIKMVDGNHWIDGTIAGVSEEEKKIYSCQYCSYRTIFQIYLKNHLKKKHNIGWTGIAAMSCCTAVTQRCKWLHTACPAV